MKDMNTVESIGAATGDRHELFFITCIRHKLEKKRAILDHFLIVFIQKIHMTTL